MSPTQCEEELKDLVAKYSTLSGVESLVSDLVEILKERVKDASQRYNQLEVKDEYLLELIESDRKLIAVLDGALDELNY